MVGTIAAFITAAELLAPTRIPAGWTTAVISFALILIPGLLLGETPRFVDFLLLGVMPVAAGVSVACTIRLGNRLRFPIMAASSTILGVGLLTFTIWAHSLVIGLSWGFAFGFSAGVGVLLWRVLCGRQLSQPSPERVPPTSDVA